MLKLHDGDAIYLSSMGKNNHVERNYIHDVQNSSGAIRMDDESTYTIIDDNVISNCNLFLTTDAHHELRNNFAINTEEFFKKRGPIDSDRNVLYSSDPQGLTYLASAREKIEFYKVESFKMVSSIYYAVNNPPGVHPGEDLCPPQSPTNGKAGLLFADPLFDQEAMKHKIFRFMPDSPSCEQQADTAANDALRALWNGRFFAYGIETDGSKRRDDIMFSGQLAGEFMVRTFGFGDILSMDVVRASIVAN